MEFSFIQELAVKLHPGYISLCANLKVPSLTLSRLLDLLSVPPELCTFKILLAWKKVRPPYSSVFKIRELLKALEKSARRDLKIQLEKDMENYDLLSDFYLFELSKKLY